MSQPVPCLCSVMVTHNASPPAGSASQACKRKGHMLCRKHTHTHTHTPCLPFTPCVCPTHHNTHTHTHTHTVSPSLRVCDPLITKPTTLQHQSPFRPCIPLFHMLNPQSAPFTQHTNQTLTPRTTTFEPLPRDTQEI